MRFELEGVPRQWRTTVIFTGMMFVAVTFLWSTSALSGIESAVVFLVAVAWGVAYDFAFGAKGGD